MMEIYKRDQKRRMNNTEIAYDMKRAYVYSTVYEGCGKKIHTPLKSCKTVGKTTFWAWQKNTQITWLAKTLIKP